MSRLLETGTGKPDSSHLGVLMWRYDELRKAGYPVDCAVALAESQADLHLAVEMIGRGCAPETAVEILT